MRAVKCFDWLILCADLVFVLKNNNLFDWLKDY